MSASTSRRRKGHIGGREPAPSPEIPPAMATTSMKRTHEEAMPSALAPENLHLYRKVRRTRVADQDIVLATRSDPAEGSSLRPELDTYMPHHQPPAPVQSPSSKPVTPIRALKPSRELSQHQCPNTVAYQKVLQAARETLTKLHGELESEKQAREQRELKIKQDMMLDVLAHKDQSEKIQAQLNKEKNRYNRLATHHKDHVEKLEKVARDERARYIKSHSDATMWREDAEHMSALYKTLEEDLDELRRLENEERMKRSDDRKAKDLPPAYGNLDDEERLPPYATHARDSGSLEVATFKRTIRDNFMNTLATAQASADELRNSVVQLDKDQAGGELFRLMSLALEQAAMSIRELLKHSMDMYCHTVKSTEMQRLAEGEAPPTVRRVIARESYIADRCAKLLIDLSLRMLSVLDLRPTPIRLTASDRVFANLAWTRIDDTLEEALGGAFNDTSANSRLWEMQFYLTQVQMLHDKFTSIRTGLPVGFFEKSWMWLSDHVEVERHLAGAKPAEAAQGRAQQAGVDGDGMSSDGGRVRIDLTEFD